MKCSVFIATSVDGFIAREDGGIDWLPSVESEPSGGDYGYSEFTSDVDFLVMGRNSYELVCTFPDWPYGETRVIVLSNTMKEPYGKHAVNIEMMSGTPIEIVAALERRGAKKLYIDGGKTIQMFMREGLISDMTITKIPVLIGTGIPLFGALQADVKLLLVRSESFSNGIVQCVYTVMKS